MDLFSIAGRIILDDGGVSSKLEDVNGKAKSTESVLGNAFSKVKSAALKVGAAVGIGFGFKAAIENSYKLAESASDLNEAQNVVDTSFGKSAKSVEAWTDTTSKSAGISKLAAMQYSGFMGAMLKSSGIGQDSAAKMSESLVQLTGDMSSFYNISTSDMWEKIRSGISGETMPLKQIGINMSEANLAAFALSEGIKKPYKSMSQSEQTMLRYQYLLNVTKDAQGDFTKTLGNSFANQMRVAELNLKSLGASIGSVLLPYFMKVVTAVNSNMPKIQSIVTSVAKAAINDIKILGPPVAGIITDIAKIIANLLSFNGSAQSVNSQAMSLAKGGLTALKTALDWMAQHGAFVKTAIIGIGGAFAAFKTLSSVAGTINKVKSTFDTLTGAAGKVKGAIGNVGTALSLVKDIKKPTELFTLINSSGKFDGLFKAVTKIGSGFAGIGGKIAGFASWLSKSTAATKIATVAQAAFDAVMSANPIAIIVIAVAALTTALIVLFNKCKPFHDWVIGALNTLKGLAVTVGNAIKTAFVGTVAGIQAAWSGITGFFTGLWNGIKSAVMAIVTPFAAGIVTAWNGVTSGISNVMNGLKTILGAAWDAIKTIVLGPVLLLCDLITGNWAKLGQDAQNIFGKLGADLSNIWKGIQQVASGAWQAITSVLSGLWSGAVGAAKAIWGGISGFFSGLWSGISGAASGAWNGIKSALSATWQADVSLARTVWGGISGFFSGLWNTVTGFFRNAWTSITSVVSNAWNGIVKFLSNPAALSTAIQNGFKAAISFITSLPGKFLQWGGDMINGLVNGIKGAIGAVVGAVTDVANTIRSFLHFSVPDKGPLSDADKYGGDFMQLLADTMDANSDKPAESAKKVAALVSSNIASIKASTAETVKELNKQLSSLGVAETKALKGVKGSEQTEIRREYEQKKETLEKEITARKEDADKEIAEIKRIGKMSKSELDKEIEDRKTFASSVNSLADQIKEALKAKYEDDEKNQENAINKSLDDLENWKTKTEDAINDVFSKREQAIEDAATLQENAIQKEIDALDDETKAEDRVDKHKEYTDKISDLEKQIKYSHDDYNTAQLQKQLAQEKADYQKELDSEAVSDKKDALQSQLQSVKDEADKEKTALEKEKQSQLDTITSIYNSKKKALNDELADVKATYDKETSDAALEAQAEKMIVDNNQKDIVKLLNSYGEQYKQAGQTLGDRLAAGFQPAIDSIKSEIASITASISSARDSAISAMAAAQQAKVTADSSGLKTESAKRYASQTNNVNVNIISPVKQTPAEQARQAKQAVQKVFFQLA